MGAPVGTDRLAAYLRDRDAVVICHAAQPAIDEHAVEAVTEGMLTPRDLKFLRNAGNSKPHRIHPRTE